MSEPIAFWIIVEYEVTDVEGFRALVTEASAISKDERGTLIYDWYIDEETKRARLHEAYDSFASLDAHTSGRVFSELSPRFSEVARSVRIDFFGELPPEHRPAEPFAPLTIWGSPAASGANPPTVNRPATSDSSHGA